MRTPVRLRRGRRADVWGRLRAQRATPPGERRRDRARPPLRARSLAAIVGEAGTTSPRRAGPRARRAVRGSTALLRSSRCGGLGPGLGPRHSRTRAKVEPRRRGAGGAARFDQARRAPGSRGYLAAAIAVAADYRPPPRRRRRAAPAARRPASPRRGRSCSPLPPRGGRAPVAPPQICSLLGGYLGRLEDAMGGHVRPALAGAPTALHPHLRAERCRLGRSPRRTRRRCRRGSC
jgi:hypothetical protein